MVDSKVLEVPFLLRGPPNLHLINHFPKLEGQFVRPNDPGPIVYRPMAVGLGECQAPLEVLRSEVGLSGGNARVLPEFMYLSLDRSGGDHVGHQVGLSFFGSSQSRYADIYQLYCRQS
ncbi:hypothetical protein O181_096616 [Austropuccinia psidii MF-1]|uniref:Uncharacterized protein n=1 Tax=Austropuccinia psidii MF-1 TaxID=1389203 RepID=A0A9Q3J7D9_9BASI|nr:hypothetical protein [Austropuccinia psidii MF-1]